MLSKLFKGRRRAAAKLDHEDRQQRLQALTEISEPTSAQLQQIEEIARGDPAPDVRRAAIARCTDTTVLHGLLDDDAVADTAARRIIDLDAGAKLNHPRLLAAMLAAGQLPEPATLVKLEPKSLVELLIASRGDAREQLLAMPALQTLPALVTLEKRSRNKDKTLNRLARDRIDAGKALHAAYTAAYERSEELLAALDKHLQNDSTGAGFKDKHQQLFSRLYTTMTELEAAAAQLKPMGIAAEGLEALQRKVNAAPQPSETSAAAPNPLNPFISLSDAFQTLECDLRESDNFDELLGRYARLNDQWLNAAEQSTPDEAAHALYRTISAQCRELASAVAQLQTLPVPLEPAVPERPPEQPDAAAQYWQAVSARKQWLREASQKTAQLRWPEWATEPEQLIRCQDAIKADNSTLDAIEQHLASRLEKLAADSEKLTSLITAGETKAAQALLASTRTTLRMVPKHRVEQLVRTLNQQAAQLGELKDWQTFATTPKRENLCIQMQALADQPLAAADQAQRIKALRTQWNELGRPANATDRSLADQFNAMAERAFEPCRAHYAEQAQQRESNRIAREGICEQLEAYLESTDFSHTDIKSAEKILRTARSEWQRFHPLARKVGKPLETRFEALQDTLYGHIKAAWDKNLAAKSAIVDAARTLLEDDTPPAQRVSAAKDLQQQWRNVGPTPRRPDQQLWHQFRAICDEIFAARDQEKQQADQAEEDNRQAATKLLDDFEAQLNGGLDGAVLRRFEAEFAALPVLPDRLARSVRQRYDTLHTSAAQQLQDQASERRAQQLIESLQQDAEHIGDGPEASIEQLQRLAIEAEIAAGIESPAADRDLRMTIQVELMNAGKSQQALSATPGELVDAWLNAGTKSTEHAQLQQRFSAAVTTLSVRT